MAARLYFELSVVGFNPRMDVQKLLPGQNWLCAIESSDFFVACLSSKSVRKTGGFEAEIRYARDCARRSPLRDLLRAAPP